MENVFVEKWRVLWYDVDGGDCNGRMSNMQKTN